MTKYSLGVGDRFAHQAKAQLQAFVEARAFGIELTPVWNKSNREHTIVGSEPVTVRRQAEAAVAALGWRAAYHLDADHINLTNVNRFLGDCDYFTVDVADYVGQPASDDAVAAFVRNHPSLHGAVNISTDLAPLEIDSKRVHHTLGKFLAAIQEAGRIYRYIAENRRGKPSLIEVSVDETDTPQTPAELLLILAMISDEAIPVQTIAPKFSGRFNKGVDYVGDVTVFEKEFEEALLVTRFAVEKLGLPEGLRLSVHSGSDKFSLYPIINRLIKKHGAGLHVKTAGTTWLEEVIGLAEADGEGLKVAAEIYLRALPRFDELIRPYAAVVDIDATRLPTAETVQNWGTSDYVAALRHDPSNPAYNVHFRQFLHVSFKVAAEMGSVYTGAFEAFAPIIARNVRDNLLRRHIEPIFA